MGPRRARVCPVGVLITGVLGGGGGKSHYGELTLMLQFMVCIFVLVQYV